MKVVFPFFWLITIFLNTVIYCQESIDTSDIDLETLLDKDIRRNEYVQSASKYSQATYESPYSLDLITSREIELYGYNKLSEVLSSLGGLFFSNDLNYQYLGLSGFGVPTDYNSRIQVLIDGHLLADHVYNSSLIDELTLNLKNVDRIEIVKGPGSVLYGGNAMFGIINIIPKKFIGSSGLSINARIGSYNSKYISGAIGLSNGNDLNFNIKANYSRTNGRDFYFNEYDTPETNNGIVENLDGEKKYGIYSSLKYGDFEISGITSYRRKDVPTAPYEVDFGTNAPTIDIFNFVEAKYGHHFSFDKTLTAKIYYDQYYFHGSYLYNNSPAWDKDNSKSIGTELQYLWDIFTNNRLIAGAEIKRIFNADYKYWDENTVYSSFDFSFNKYALYLQDEHHFTQNVALYLALRYDDFGKTGNKLTPRITAIFSPDKANTVRLLWGTSFKVPTLYEKYYEDLNAGDKSNPNLKTEEIYTYEFNWNNRTFNWLTFNASLFYSQINNLIDQAISSEDSMSFYDNKENIKINGLKLETVLTFSNNSGGYMNYAWQKAKNHGGDEIINSPENLIKAGLYYGMWDLNASLEYIYETSRLTYSEVRTSEVHYAALSLSNLIPFQGFKFSFRVNNLLNKIVNYPAGREHLQSYFTMPGRNFMFSVSYELL